MVRVHRWSVLFLAVAFVVVLAGCTGGGGTPTATAAGDAGGGDDGGASGDGDDSSGDGSEENDAATPTATATATATATPTTPNTTGPVTTERLPTLGELLKYEDEHRYRIEVDRLDGESVDYVQEGRWHSGDFSAQVTVEGENYEVYDIDGRQYFVIGGQCQQLSVDSTRNPGNWTEQGSEGNQSVRPVDTTTIDGQEVYVYELETDHPEGSATSTLYVNAETGYVVRQEVLGVTVETWDWGNVEPVEAPC
ncbi:MAG: hypothetical protein V5A44_03045 [Haloarculaceae archaeon]